jgi:tRNA pseudouridine55 synthase
VTQRGATALRGILSLDKPAGMTSHDVVARVRTATGEGRVGHAGTLDPMATGLLVVLVGAYTRLAPYLSPATKTYDATIAFGSETDTDDAQGDTVRRAPLVPELWEPAFARRILSGFVGRSLQVPPAYSALKVGGKVAYRAARAGSPLDLAPREIDVVRAEITGIDAEAGAWRVTFVVSKGTYVRALARDIGRACGCAAHLSALRRTASGTLSLAGAHTLEEVAAAAAGDVLSACFTDPLAALGLPALEADRSALRSGAPLPLPAGASWPRGAAFALTLDGRLAAVYRVTTDGLAAAVVLPEGERS